MPLLDASVNADDIQILRPIEGIGGDRNFRVVHHRLRGYVEEEARFDRDQQAATNERAGLVILQPHDGEGRVLDIQAGDYVRYSDWKGVAQRREIRRIMPQHVLGTLDAIELEVD